MAAPVLETTSDAEAKWDTGDAFVDERLKKSSSANDFLPSEPETTRNELWGWYLFAWAADGYTGATSSVFQPLIISAMATLGGRSTVDHNSSCTSATSCEVLFGTVWVSPTSYSLYSSAISVLAQAFVTISLAALADHSGYGKIYMFSFAGVACVSVMLWLALEDPKLYFAANILNIVGNVCYGAAFVFYTSYIPKLARNHPDVLNAVTPDDRIEKLTFRTSRISIFGSATGFLGGFIQMLIAVGILLAMNQTLFSLKVATFIGGVWWGLFAIYPMFTLKRRPGPPLPKGEHFLTYSWKQLYKKVRQAKQLSQLFYLLIFWFFVSDSASTILQVAVLFAQNEVHVSSEKTLIGAMLDLFCAVPGMLFWHFLQKRFKLKPKTLIFGLTILTGAVPIYVLGGLSPLPGGFKAPNEFLGLCCYYGFVQPALFAFSRALFAQLIPRGHENKFFSLFSITQAGGGWIGPLITGVIGDATGQMRYSMIFVLATMYIPLGLLYFIDVGKGHEEAESFLANEIAEKQAQESMELDSKA